MTQNCLVSYLDRSPPRRGGSLTGTILLALAAIFAVAVAVAAAVWAILARLLVAAAVAIARR